MSTEKIWRSKNPNLMDFYVAEGVEAIVPYKGGAVTVIRQLVGGLKSGLSYWDLEISKNYKQTASS